jgi:peptidoglycan/LPS O-acetylase OafA/YrhL
MKRSIQAGLASFPASSGGRRIAELDGLRGLAILLVVVAHYVAYALPDSASGGWRAYWLGLFRLTWTGVDLFFVLSGFLIGGLLCDAKFSRNYYRTFYFRRLYRIVPLYFLWIATFAIGLHFVGAASAGPLRAIFNHDVPTWSYPLFVQNIIMAHRQTFGASWTAATWSLAIEEQFYLLLPLLVRTLSGPGIMAIALVAISSAPVIRTVLWVSGNPYVGRYTLLPCRADALGFGVLAALICRNPGAWLWLSAHRNFLYAALLSLGCAVASLAHFDWLLYNIGLTCIDAFYAALLLLAVVSPGRMESGFRNQVLVKIGTVSYAIYIFHLGINELIHFAVFGREARIVDWSSLFVTLASFAVVILLSALSWGLLEKPLIRHAHSVYRY